MKILLLYLAASGLALLIAGWAMLFGYAGLLLTFGGRSQALAVLATTLMTATSLGTLAGDRLDGPLSASSAADAPCTTATVVPTVS